MRYNQEIHGVGSNHNPNKLMRPEDLCLRRRCHLRTCTLCMMRIIRSMCHSSNSHGACSRGLHAFPVPNGTTSFNFIFFNQTVLIMATESILSDAQSSRFLIRRRPYNCQTDQQTGRYTFQLFPNQNLSLR